MGEGLLGLRVVREKGQGVSALVFKIGDWWNAAVFKFGHWLGPLLFKCE